MSKQGQGYTIFVADDEAEVVDLVQIVLESEGYTVQIAADGKEALAKIHAQPPDLILLDMRMPGMTGLTVLDHIQADPAIAQIPAIMLSVVVTEPEVRKALDHGAVAYLSKPFEIRELAWLVKHILNMDAAEREQFRQHMIVNIGKR